MTDHKIEEDGESIINALPEEFWKEFAVLSKKLLEAEEKNLSLEEMKKISAEMQKLFEKYQ